MISNILPKGKKFIFTIIDDTDDSFTILMIIHAFNVKEELTDEENQIKETIQSQMKFWFDQL